MPLNLKVVIEANVVKTSKAENIQKFQDKNPFIVKTLPGDNNQGVEQDIKLYEVYGYDNT